MNADDIKERLCDVLCGGLSVAAVPIGMAVSTAFVLPDGDVATFYIVETPDGLSLEDDGDFIATSIASGLPIDTGTRGRLLDGILASEGAHLDRDTCQIKSGPVAADDLGAASIRFISALVRARDLHLLTQEQVASTFAEDVREAMETRFGDRFVVGPETGTDNPADLVLIDRDTGHRAATVYAANSNEKLLSAMIRHAETKPGSAPVIAVMDAMPSANVSSSKFMMAQNRGLHMPFFRTDPEGAMTFIEKHLSAVAA